MIVKANEKISAWISQAHKIRSLVYTGRGIGIPDQVDLCGKTGAQIIDEMMNGKIPVAPSAHRGGYLIVERTKDKVVMQGEPTWDELNPMRLVNGGWISTVMDSAMGSAVLNRLPESKSYVTKELKVEFITALKFEQVPFVRVEAQTDFETGKLANAKAVMYGPDEKTIYARATCVCRVFSVPTI